jgi:hypothetical protein
LRSRAPLFFAFLDFSRFCTCTFALLDFHARNFVPCVYIRLGQDSQDNTPRTGKAEQDSQNMTAKTGQPEQDSKNRTARTGQQEQDSKHGTGRTRLPWQESQDIKVRTGQAGT